MSPTPPAPGRPSRLATIAGLIGIGVLVIACVLFLASGGFRNVRVAGRPAVIRTTELDTVNVWRSYTDRSKGIVGTVKNGERVEFLRAQGGGALIRAGSIEGWVNAALVDTQ